MFSLKDRYFSYFSYFSYFAGQQKKSPTGG